MEPHVDESEDPAIDDTEDSIDSVQRTPSNGDSTAPLDGMEDFIDSVQPNPSYGDGTGASRDDGASSSQGTQDAEQDHQGGLVNSNQQPVEPNRQDEANPGGAQEEEEEEAAGGAGGRFNLNLEGGFMFRCEQLLIMDALPPNPWELMMLNMVNSLYQHPGHMLAEREINARAQEEDRD